MNAPPRKDNLPEPVDFFSLPLRPLTEDALIATLIERARSNARTDVHYLNAHTFTLARKCPELWNILARSDLLYTDGMSVVWASRLLGKGVPQRLSSADYFTRYCGRLCEEGMSMFLLGGGRDVIRQASQTLQKQYPSLRIAGYQDGYFDLSDSSRIADQINQSGADILVVGMGSPRQELWLAEWGTRLHTPVRWCVGALFDYFAGSERRAPEWITRNGLEWLYRFCQDPTGKWRRYLLGNARFIAYIASEYLRRQGIRRIKGCSER